MKQKFRIKGKLLAFSVVGITLIAIIAFYVMFNYSVNSGSIALTAEAATITGQTSENSSISVNPGLPRRLKIPKIGVDASVESVGITSNNEMEVPINLSNVAWYSLGKRPGENGSAVIAGHLDQENGAPAVFNKLHKMQNGDKIYLKNDNGETITFVVSGSRSYESDAKATEVFTSNDGKSHLNLITCEGTWNTEDKSYSRRFVVFADKQ